MTPPATGRAGSGAEPRAGAGLLVAVALTAAALDFPDPSTWRRRYDGPRYRCRRCPTPDGQAVYNSAPSDSQRG